MFSIFRRKPHAAAAAAMYQRMIVQSRAPAFYRELGVPDTVDGRFDMAVLHAFLLMHRLQAERDGPALNQAIFDAMFAHLDLTLREMGVQDLGVGRRIKIMADAFNGRSAAYRQAFEQEDRSALREALRRNVYGEARPGPDQLEHLVDYAQAANRSLAGQDTRALLRAQIDLPELSAGAGAAGS